MRHKQIHLLGLLVGALGLCGLGVGLALGTNVAAKSAVKITPAISVAAQKTASNTITVARVISAEDSWLVIHRVVNGEPEQVIGYARVKKGTLNKVKVKINAPAKVTPVLAAMLHRDLGKKGTYEFPGADVPTISGKTIVIIFFKIQDPPVQEKNTPTTSTKPAPEQNSAATPKATTKDPLEAGSKTGQDAPAKTAEPMIKEIALTAKQWSFEPNTITVNKGAKVRLKITSVDVDHGFSIWEYAINKTIPGGKTVIVEFDADQAGTFSFVCSIFCGSGHGGMEGTLIVNP